MRSENRSGVALALGLVLALAGCSRYPPEAEGDVSIGAVSNALTTVNVPQAVAAGAYHSLFLRKDGSVLAWGQNVAGQLGTGNTSSTPLPHPSQVNGLPAIKAVAAGIAHSLALDVEGNVWAWGQNASGQTGLGIAGGTVLVPTRVATLAGIQAIAANGNFSLALGADGRLWAWGQNVSGQVGTGATSSSVAVPRVVQGLPSVRAVAAGVNHTLALATDGTVWGWGLNTSAQVGTGGTSSAVLAPALVAGLPSAKAVAAGAGHSLIIDEQFGNVWAWGQNIFGQVGTGSSSATPVVTPIPVNGVFAVTTIVAGHNSSLALIGNGLAVAWGNNASGQLGNGSTANSASPVGVTGVSDATALAAGAQHVLALRPGCPVWAWGNNGQGQLGMGSTSTTSVLAPALALITNTFYFDGDMDGFGDEYITEHACEPSPGFVAELDCDDYSATTHPGAVETCNGVDDNCDGVVDDGDPGGGEGCATGQPGVCAAGVTACTLGSVVCQQLQAASAEQCDGLDNDCDGQVDEGNPGGLQACATGQLGVCGEGVTYCTHGGIECVPMRAPSAEVCDAEDNNCDGQVDEGLPLQTWYRDQDGDGYGLASQVVQACMRSSGYVSNDGDCDDADAAVRPGAPEVCDGKDNNCDGQMDEGSTQGGSACIIPPDRTRAAGTNHSLAVKAGGTVWSWGFNLWGQLGDGTTTDRRTPVQVPGIAGVVALAAGEIHNLALKSDGAVWAWGHNSSGELGNGTRTRSLTPIQVPGLARVIAVAAGYGFSAVLKSDGTVWAWGNNSSGVLGDGTTTSRLSPAQVPGLSGVVALSATIHSIVALKWDGTVWTWGKNYNGALGDGTTTDRLAPVQVSGLSGVVAIAAGGYHTLALKADGTVWAWGDNGGKLGDGTTTNRLVPVQVQGLSGVVSFAVGHSHSMALMSDGTVWAWGGNYYSELGDGTTTRRLIPARIQALSGVVGLAAGNLFSFAEKSDGTAWAWGYNGTGQLGDGTTTNRSVPVRVQGF